MNELYIIEIYYKIYDRISFNFFKSGRKRRKPEITDINEMDTLITSIDDNGKGIIK